ncbi:lipopolysaccharide export system permease protein [Lampropedia hyalina DSM 16112]|uniref:Lipopolysaccharide export system permease protein n=1 Tax=Lampropedia hyalina DSM 16112 TaxID=1122156 RepID=A0A1M4YEC6_9BURK|nr:LPS export ABC transporter permease LptG [Lampropedia hyalina]SHF04100.1 lipopolysaccharide export system permease protein [Lampropedia hyalina DSM 16112]
MRIATRMLQREIIAAVALTSIAFLALLMFFDLISETRFISRSGSQSYGMGDALLHMALSAPMHLYELLPICALIGTVFVMARYAQTSQFTILRTGGLGPGRALGILLSLGVFFTALTWVLGDYVVPWSERAANTVRAQHLNLARVTGQNAWLRERQGEESIIIYVGTLHSDGQMNNLRIFRFAPNGEMLTRIDARQARLEGTQWQLQQAVRNDFPPRATADDASAPPSAIRTQFGETMPWDSGISLEMVTAAVLKPDGMSTLELFGYVEHLKANNQSAQKYELELWRKVFYPLSCLVMMVLALPFAYLHFRSGGIMGYVFGGIMVGISYLLLNNVLGYMGNIHQWSALLTSAIPGVLYSIASLAAFGWLVLRR